MKERRERRCEDGLRERVKESEGEEMREKREQGEKGGDEWMT